MPILDMKPQMHCQRNRQPSKSHKHKETGDICSRGQKGFNKLLVSTK